MTIQNSQPIENTYGNEIIYIDIGRLCFNEILLINYLFLVIMLSINWYS